MAAADGLNNKEIASKVGVCAATVGTWRNRFAQRRMDGLYDEPRPGAPREIGDDEIAATIRKTLETLPKGATHWSLRTMAKEIGHAPSTVHRMWQAFGLQPHRVECMPRHRATEFRKFLDEVERNVPTDLDIHVIMDNYGSHKTKLIRNWFAKRPRWHLHFTPTSASWINQVERFFALLTERTLRRGVFRSVAGLENGN